MKNIIKKVSSLKFMNSKSTDDDLDVGLSKEIKGNNIQIFCEKIKNMSYEELNERNKNGDTMFIIACELKRYQIIDILLSQNIDPFLKNHNGMSGIDHLSNHVSDSELRDAHKSIIIRLLEMKNKNENISSSKSSHKSVILGQGSFGKVWRHSDSAIIKEYKYNDNSLCNSMNEIAIMSKINKYYGDVCPKILKIQVTKGNYELCMSKYKCNLLQIIKAYKHFEERERVMFFKKIFIQLLMCVEKIHKIGILHSDIKSENIMMDYDGTVRLIDFGTSTILNFNPTILQRVNLITTPYVESMDGKKSNIFTGSSLKSYHSDVYSIGMVFYECVMGVKEDSSCHYVYDDFYKYKFKKMNAINQKSYEKMKSFSDDFIDLMKIMLNGHGVNRWSPTELLNHKFFGGNKVYEDRFDEKINLVHDGMSILTKYSDAMILNRSYEMYYFNEIHTAHLHEKFGELNLSKMDKYNGTYFTAIDFILRLCESAEITYIDTIVNIIDNLHDYVDFSDSMNTIKVKCMALCYMISELCHEGVPTRNKICEYSNDCTREELSKQVMKMICSGIIEIKSVNVHISYITINLQKMGISETDKTYKYLCKKIIVYMIFRHMVKDFDQTIWEIVQALFHGSTILSPSYEFLSMPKNDEFIHKLNSLSFMNKFSIKYRNVDMIKNLYGGFAKK